MNNYIKKIIYLIFIIIYDYFTNTDILLFANFYSKLFLALSGFLIKKIIFNSNDVENFEENCYLVFISWFCCFIY